MGKGTEGNFSKHHLTKKLSINNYIRWHILKTLSWQWDGKIPKYIEWEMNGMAEFLKQKTINRMRRHNF